MVAKARQRAGLSAVVIAAAGYAFWQLQRVEQGHLFALSLPWDRPPTWAEILDARQSAHSYLLPAIAVVLTIGGLAIAFFPRIQFPLPPQSRSGKIAAAFFLVAALADLVTTLAFFHRYGANYELHPGIRLFGYAYGPTIGPIAGKALQAFGILLIAALVGRLGILLLGVTTVVYAAAAVHNYFTM